LTEKVFSEKVFCVHFSISIFFANKKNTISLPFGVLSQIR